MFLQSWAQGFKGDFLEFGVGVNSQVIEIVSNLEGVIKTFFSIVIDRDGQLDFTIGLASCSTNNRIVKGDMFGIGGIPIIDDEITLGMVEMKRGKVIANLHGYDVDNWIFFCRLSNYLWYTSLSNNIIETW